MSENSPLERIAEKYRKEGYDVIVRPPQDELPAFLGDAKVDILVRKRDHLVAFQVKDLGLAEAEAIDQLAANLGAGYAVSVLEEAETLLNPQTKRSALAMAWAAFEAAAREALYPGEEAFAGATPRKLLEELAAKGLVAQDELARLYEYMRLRTLVVHGVRPTEIPPAAVSLLLAITRRLLGQMAGNRIGIRDSVSITVLRGSINQWPKLQTLVEQATQILGQLLGPSRGTVSVEWDLAEAGNREAILVLRLSDLTGTATATFGPSELQDESRMRARLNRLWGDLLEIRSHKQVERLLASTGEK
jgi:hypothetical protein